MAVATVIWLLLYILVPLPYQPSSSGQPGTTRMDHLTHGLTGHI